MKLKYSNFNITPKSVNAETYSLEAVFSSGSIDRHGEIVDQKSWQLESFMENPVVLFGHDHTQPPVGKVTALGYDTNGDLCGTVQFAAKEYPFANTIWQLYKEGYMRAFSVGFAAGNADVENGTVVLRDNQLFELSAVPVPANALALAKSKGLDLGGFDATLELDEKSTVPFMKFPLADESQAWDGGAARDALIKLAGGPDKNKMDWSKYSQGFAWYDETDKENFGSYKLPHHDVIGGEMKTVWSGVAASMAALQGGRGGVDVPADQKLAIYNHLVKHYKEFKKTPPDFNKMLVKSVDSSVPVEPTIDNVTLDIDPTAYNWEEVECFTFWDNSQLLEQVRNLSSQYGPGLVTSDDNEDTCPVCLTWVIEEESKYKMYEITLAENSTMDSNTSCRGEYCVSVANIDQSLDLMKGGPGSGGARDGAGRKPGSGHSSGDGSAGENISTEETVASARAAIPANQNNGKAEFEKGGKDTHTTKDYKSRVSELSKKMGDPHVSKPPKGSRVTGTNSWVMKQKDGTVDLHVVTIPGANNSGVSSYSIWKGIDLTAKKGIDTMLEGLAMTVKSGKVLSSANRTAIEAAITALQQVLEADRPVQEPTKTVSDNSTKLSVKVETPVVRVSVRKDVPNHARNINKAIRALLAEKRKH